MRFEVTQRFEVSAEQVMALYCDPSFYPLLDGVGMISDPDVLEHEDKGDSVEMQIRFRFTGDLPSAATKIVKPDKLTWVEHTTFNLADLTSTTKIVPDYYPDRLQASADAKFANVGSGATRSVRGDLKVHVFLVGGKVENAIVSGMKDHLVDEAKIANKRLG